MNTSDTYTLCLFGSRASSGGDLTIEFSVNGGAWLSLETKNNINVLAEVPSLSPNDQGELVIDARIGNANGYGFLGAIELVED